MNTRPGYSAEIIYLSSGQNRLKDVGQVAFTNESGSQEYEGFLKEVGWKVDLAKHRGFHGGLSAQFCQSTLYYSSESYELVLHISTLIKASEKEGESGVSLLRKKTLLGRNYVVVVWLEDLRQINITSIKLSENKVFVIIRPTRFGIYNIEVICSANISVGPLVDGMMVSRRSLPELLRATIVSVNQQLEELNSKKQQPLEAREKFIRSCLEKYTPNLKYYKKMTEFGDY